MLIKAIYPNNNLKLIGCSMDSLKHHVNHDPSCRQNKRSKKSIKCHNDMGFIGQSHDRPYILILRGTCFLILILIPDTRGTYETHIHYVEVEDNNYLSFRCLPVLVELSPCTPMFDICNDLTSLDEVLEVIYPPRLFLYSQLPHISVNRKWSTQKQIYPCQPWVSWYQWAWQIWYMPCTFPESCREPLQQEILDDYEE